MATNTDALSIWLRFDHPDDEDASHEATIDRDGERFRTDWCNTAVGLISSRYHDTYEDAALELERDGYLDFTA